MKRWCEYCDGRGYRYEGYGIGTQKCRVCGGEQQVHWPKPEEWRPHEPMKREDDNGTHLC